MLSSRAFSLFNLDFRDECHIANNFSINNRIFHPRNLRAVSTLVREQIHCKDSKI
jgi:hypothetical protein